MKRIFLVPIEPLDNRYSKQWFEYLPKRLKEEFPNYEIINIAGYAIGYDKPMAGAFFNWACTCEYKASQAVSISQLFQNGEVHADDIFLFTDAWNPTIHSIKYISELNGIPVKCAGIWHAGWYDPTDILGFTIQNADWVRPLELSMYEAFDMNFFATIQHMDKFLDRHIGASHRKAYVCGQPYDYLSTIFDGASFEAKRKMVIFPHRLNEDKAPWVFDLIRDYVHNTLGRTDIDFVKTQELNLDKQAYYQMMKEAMVIFSANKHENLGVGTFEAMMLGAYPMLPNKLSYKEMYPADYKYPTIPDMYEPEMADFWQVVADEIVEKVDGYNHDTFTQILEDSQYIFKKYFTAALMIDCLRGL